MPRLNTFRTYKFTGDVYNYTTTTAVGGSTVYNYTFLKNIKIDLHSTSLGGVTMFFDEEAAEIMPRAQIRNIKDRTGQQMYPGSIWTLRGLIPSLTFFGTREGFQSEARVTHETDA